MGVSCLAAGRVEFSDRSWLPALGPHAQERRTVRPQQDDAIAVPGSRNKPLHLAQGLWKTAREIDSLQMAGGDEGNGTAIRRPEGILAALGSRNPLDLETVERPQPEFRIAVRSFRRRHKPFPVRRDYGRGESTSQFFRKNDLKSHWLRRLGSSADQKHTQNHAQNHDPDRQ